MKEFGTYIFLLLAFVSILALIVWAIEHLGAH
jgi:hypothetical protein